MKQQLVLLLAAAFQLSAMAQNKYYQEPFLTKSFAGQSFQHVKSVTSGGNISVTGTDEGPRVEVYIGPGNNRDRDLSKEEIQKRLDEEYDLEISVSNDKLTASARPKDEHMSWRNSLSISFRLFVPHKVSTDLSTSGGNISLSGLSGARQDFSTSGGNLGIDNVAGNINGRTSGGNITLTNSKDEIDVSTSGGNIRAENCDGNMTLSTSGGSLALHTLKGRIRATTSGGSVRAEGVGGELSAHTSGGNVTMSDLTCSVDASTSGGNIDVNINELGKYVKLNNSGGSIHLSIPGGKGLDLKLYADKIRTGALNNFSGDFDETHVTGTLNGGGIPVTVDGGGGRISLELR